MESLLLMVAMIAVFYFLIIRPENKRKKQARVEHAAHGGGCPGHQVHRVQREEPAAAATAGGQPSQLGQWPCQIKLVPVNAPYFRGAKLPIAADCTAYAYGNFHADVSRGGVTLIGCPKLDTADYEGKLTAILTENDVRSVMLTRMEVPCCGGLEYAARQAIAHSGRALPLLVVTISAEGRTLQEHTT